VLFATAGASTRPAQMFAERMGPRVIPKPISSEELRIKVRKAVLGASGKAPELRSAHVDARNGTAH
jgi:hypothetical protein